MHFQSEYIQDSHLFNKDRWNSRFHQDDLTREAHFNLSCIDKTVSSKVTTADSIFVRRPIPLQTKLFNKVYP